MTTWPSGHLRWTPHFQAPPHHPRLNPLLSSESLPFSPHHWIVVLNGSTKMIIHWDFPPSLHLLLHPPPKPYAPPPPPCLPSTPLVDPPPSPPFP
jgi:hypothetical protein